MFDAIFGALADYFDQTDENRPLLAETLRFSSNLAFDAKSEVPSTFFALFFPNDWEIKGKNGLGDLRAFTAKIVIP